MHRPLAVVVPLAAALAAATLAPRQAAAQPCLLGVGNNCPPPSAGTSDSGRGFRTYEGALAQEILNAQTQGGRYLLVLAAYQDPALNCRVEERAWVAGLRGAGNGRVVVEVGPTRKVCVNAVYDVATVNRYEALLHTYRNALAEWLKYQENLGGYLNDPRYRQWAAAESQRAQATIDSYRQWITAAQTGLAASVP